MNQPAAAPERERFVCSICSVAYPYDYHGRRPPFAPAFTFLEDVYVLRDPFVEQKTAPLPLGGQCAVCHKAVCAAPEVRVMHGALNLPVVQAGGNVFVCASP